MVSDAKQNQPFILRPFLFACSTSVIIFLMGIGFGGCADTKPEVSVSKKETVLVDAKSIGIDYSKPPFTADEFIEKTVQLVQIHHRYITPRDIEKVFNLRFSNVTYTKEGDGYFAKLDAEKDWYFDVSLRANTEKFKGAPVHVKDGAASFLRIEWKMNSFGDPLKGECLTPERLKTIMAAREWDFYGVDRPLVGGPWKESLMFSKNGQDVIEFEIRHADEKHPECAIAVEANGIP